MLFYASDLIFAQSCVKHIELYMMQYMYNIFALLLAPITMLFSHKKYYADIFANQITVPCTA